MKKKVLVVDDQAELRHLVKFTLRSRYKVVEAANAGEAYDMIQAEPPDAVVLDVMMPGSMNGFQLCEKLRREDGLWSLPIILLTAREQWTDQLIGNMVGADYYITKPFSPVELLRVVNSLFV